MPGKPSFVFWIVLPALGLGWQPTQADDELPAKQVSHEMTAPFDASRLGWTSLVLEASKLGLSGSAKVSLNLVLRDRLANQLIETLHEAAVAPDGRDILLADYHMLAVGQNFRDQLWFAADSGAALQRVKINMTPRHERYRSYRFTRTGVFRMRKKPGEDQIKQSHEHWTDIKTTFNRFSRELPHGMEITSPSILLYVVSVVGLQESEKIMDIVSYFDDNLHTVSIQKQKAEKLEVDFVAVSGNRKRRIKGVREALLFSITSRPYAGQNYESKIELAGLRGDLQIYVDKRMNVPLELARKSGWFNTFQLRLRNVVLR